MKPIRQDTYKDTLDRKAISFEITSINPQRPISDQLFPFQKRIVEWALERGRCAIFADCGLGKTLMQLEWASHIPGDVLILTPLAVASQTKRESDKFGYSAEVSRDGEKKGQITITNYHQLHRFDPSDFAGVVLDESSILKNYTGKTRDAIIDAFCATKYKLACTATPAPNDHMELGNHAEFLGAMTRTEMLATFFTHDGGETSKWRVKGHARDDFWRWCGTWAVMCTNPSDLGQAFDMPGYVLPDLQIHQHIVDTDYSEEGELFPEATTLTDMRGARRASMPARIDAAASLVSDSDEPWIIWCELNDESTQVARAITDAVEVAGSHDNDTKSKRMLGFGDSKYRVLVTKPKIAGFGMNWQHCAHVAFIGLSHSYEQYYQAIRRCWRFGQTRPVNVHIFTSSPEMATVRNIERKKQQADEMGREMIKHMGSMEATGGLTSTQDEYSTSTTSGSGWDIHLGDCVETLGSVDSDSIDFSIFSPPFASLYTYSASTYDMGNCKSHGQFFEQFGFLVDQLLRVTRPGRLLSFHCMNLPTSKSRDGYIGISDFRGALIRAFIDKGWIFHSEVTIWKDPVVAMQRTKALGLLYKQLRKDSCMSRQGIPDYLVTMRKPGENPNRATKTHEGFPVGLWQKFASPVWMDIDPSDTLQHRSARENEDERHICPLQLGVIRRAVALWTNPGDLILSPFAGIGSEGVVALEMDRRFIGMELKKSYYDQACSNLASCDLRQLSLWDI